MNLVDDESPAMSIKDDGQLRALRLSELDSLCDHVSATAQERGLTEALLADILEEEC